MPLGRQCVPETFVPVETAARLKQTLGVYLESTRWNGFRKCGLNSNGETVFQAKKSWCVFKDAAHKSNINYGRVELQGGKHVIFIKCFDSICKKELKRVSMMPAALPLQLDKHHEQANTLLNQKTKHLSTHQGNVVKHTTTNSHSQYYDDDDEDICAWFDTSIHGMSTM